MIYCIDIPVIVGNYSIKPKQKDYFKNVNKCYENHTWMKITFCREDIIQQLIYIIVSKVNLPYR